MADRRSKVLIVGGGPSGATAAMVLASSGAEVCVIDRSEFPRDKLCGGLVTTRSAKVLERIFPDAHRPAFETEAKKADFCFGLKNLATAHSAYPLYFVQRRKFDHLLLEAAKSAGATFRSGARLKSVDLAAKTVSLDDDSSVSFDYLIGADGVNSQVARSLYGESFDAKKIGFALEVELPRSSVREQIERPEIHFGAVQWGYGWVFPKEETYTVGIGGVHDINPDLKDRLVEFFNGRFPNVEMPKIKGHFIPFGDFRKEPGKASVLLCGDAAGLVDSITGEGIAFALESGEAAALAVIQAMRSNSNKDAYPLYLKRYRAIADHVRASNFYRNFIYTKWARPLFVKLLPDASTLQRGYLEILAGERSYSTMPGLLVVQAAKAARKLIQKALGMR